jgi:hypothetical protein
MGGCFACLRLEKISEELSQWPFALLIAEVAIHQLIVNRETLHPGALARYAQRKRIICFSQPGLPE